MSVIDKLKDIAINATWADERKKAIDTLGEGKCSTLDALIEVGQKGRWSDEREIALDKAKKIISEGKCFT